METKSPIIKKLQLKDQSTPVLIVNAPIEYKEVMEQFSAPLHTERVEQEYFFIQVFGTEKDTLQANVKEQVRAIADDGLFWVCYPKKTSKAYKGSDCSRDIVGAMLADEGYEPVRQVAIDEDWSALRFRKVEHIKSLKRKVAVSEKGKQRISE
ncbi:DUF3052 domain-containing protein [Bacillus sp. FJAT-45037]|uniref:DUF3052 domain-containing protein n=1 Tax=Bacillus sp. FJAT-45037 TaxID=2011007 RepID=UPI000C24522B|nr:DUF3052 domain-containing protein [Bacillus sp. FJAT-45037]